MSTAAAEIETFLREYVIGHSIVSIDWDGDSNIPLFTLENGDSVSFETRISHSDYELCLSLTRNGDCRSYYDVQIHLETAPLLDDKVGEPVSTAADIQNCVGHSVDHFALRSASALELRFLFSNQTRLRYFVSYAEGKSFITSIS